MQAGLGTPIDNLKDALVWEAEAKYKFVKLFVIMFSLLDSAIGF